MYEVWNNTICRDCLWFPSNRSLGIGGRGVVVGSRPLNIIQINNWFFCIASAFWKMLKNQWQNTKSLDVNSMTWIGHWSLGIGYWVLGIGRRSLVAGSRQLNIMKLIVGSFVLRRHFGKCQEPMAKYQIIGR